MKYLLESVSRMKRRSLLGSERMGGIDRAFSNSSKEFNCDSMVICHFDLAPFFSISFSGRTVLANSLMNRRYTFYAPRKDLSIVLSVGKGD